MPNYLMQWKMIQDSIEDGCILYDFRGVSGSLNPKHPLYGLYKFKKGFGGDFVEFIGLQCLVTNKPVHLLCRTALPVYRKVRRVLATNSL